VLTAEVLEKAQEMLDAGLETAAVAEQLGVKRDTLAKAIGAGRLRKLTKKKISIHRRAARGGAVGRMHKPQWG
jgi:hypothetical protein